MAVYLPPQTHLTPHVAELSCINLLNFQEKKKKNIICFLKVQNYFKLSTLLFAFDSRLTYWGGWTKNKMKFLSIVISYIKGSAFSMRAWIPQAVGTVGRWASPSRVRNEMLGVNWLKVVFSNSASRFRLISRRECSSYRQYLQTSLTWFVMQFDPVVRLWSGCIPCADLPQRY